MSADQRDGYWDAVKGILISLVVVGHFFSNDSQQLGDKIPAHRGVALHDLFIPYAAVCICVRSIFQRR